MGGKTGDSRQHSFMHGYELCRSWLSLPEAIRTVTPVSREDLHHVHVAGRQKGGRHCRDSLEGLSGGASVPDAGGGPLTCAREFAALRCRVTVPSVLLFPLEAVINSPRS